MKGRDLFARVGLEDGQKNSGNSLIYPSNQRVDIGRFSFFLPPSIYYSRAFLYDGDDSSAALFQFLTDSES